MQKKIKRKIKGRRSKRRERNEKYNKSNTFTQISLQFTKLSFSAHKVIKKTETETETEEPEKNHLKQAFETLSCSC